MNNLLLLHPTQLLLTKLFNFNPSVLAKWKLLSPVRFFVTPCTIKSMEFSRPEYWSGQPFPSAGDLPNPVVKPRSPTLQADSLSAETSGKPSIPWFMLLIFPVFLIHYSAFPNLFHFLWSVWRLISFIKLCPTWQQILTCPFSIPLSCIALIYLSGCHGS